MANPVRQRQRAAMAAALGQAAGGIGSGPAGYNIALGVAPYVNWSGSATPATYVNASTILAQSNA